MNFSLRLVLLTLVFTAPAGIAAADSAAAPVASFTLDAAKPGPVINQNIYGHFAEHLGRCIYEGIWVGENSPIPNTRGYRNDVLAALKTLQVPQVRWPGGCFADEYHWRDGIGPREKRPAMINTHWGGVVENNHFGTHEFLDLCEQLGTDPYICGNVGSGSVQEMMEWVEYMTSAAHSPMANIAQMVNVLQAMILTDKEKMIVTPTYHVFEMFKVHQGATSLPLALTTPDYVIGGNKIPALSASASRDQAGKIHVSFANCDAGRPLTVTGRLAGVTAKSATGRILTAPAINSHNTFAAPDTVKPAPFSGATLAGDTLTVTLPARSVVVLELN